MEIEAHKSLNEKNMIQYLQQTPFLSNGIARKLWLLTKWFEELLINLMMSKASELFFFFLLHHHKDINTEKQHSKTNWKPSRTEKSYSSPRFLLAARSQTSALNSHELHQ